MRKFLFALLLTFLFTGAFAAPQEYTADVAIVGGGWSGMIAAISSGEAGLKTVVLEKNPSLGGSGPWLNMTAAYGADPSTTVDQGYSKFMEFGHNYANAIVARTLYKALPGNVKWLRDHGVELVWSPCVPGRISICFPGYIGTPLIRNFNERISKLSNITVLTETPGVRLIVDNGAVKGVIGDNDGEEVRVNAKYTILATGPIVGNPEMLKKYAPWLGDGYIVIGAPGRTGDGITLAEQAGARIDASVGLDTESAWPMGLTGYHEVRDDLGYQALFMVLKSPFLRVNSLGKRIMREDMNSFHMESHSLSRNNNVYWTIFDESLKQDFIKKGLDGLKIPPPIVPPVKNPFLTALDAGLEKAYAAGYAYKANTVEELAQKMGADPKILKATVDRMNAFAKAGKDDDLLLSKDYLRSYSKAPFYALKGVHTILNSNGGIQCDENFQALGQDLKPIPGLFVTGVLIGSYVGDTYPMFVAPGNSSGFGIAASRLIIEHVAKEVKK
jgi:fumarate reductase flavoprotein subunit